VRVSGNGLNIAAPVTVGGLGFNNSGGALENFTGDNTWSGPVLLGGLNNNQGQTGLNQIGAAAGTTLTISGVIQNNTSSASWAKVGAGDLVLTGASPNTYTNLTRLFDGRLIVEKNGALGTAGLPDAATGNTFQLPASASTLAFRANGVEGFDYTTFEVINTEGSGAPGFAQIDNLAGTNTFAGQIAFGGPTLSGIIQSTIDVTAGSLEVKGGLFARGTGGVRNITKSGVGALIVSGASGTAGGNPNVVPLSASTFNINAGSVELRGATPATQVLPGITTWNVNAGGTLRSTGGTVAGAVVNVSGGGALLFDDGSMSLTALNLNGGNATVSAGGGKVLLTNSLSVTTGGRADLGDNDAVVNYPAGVPSPLGSWNGNAYTEITGLIQSGRNGGSWDGGGVMTSQSDAVTGLTSLGVGEAGEMLGLAATATALWHGQSVDGSAVLVMYTYTGDATLDGKIDVDDYGKIDTSIGLINTGWVNGDFNYDGKINVDDYAIIDSTIVIQGPSLAAATPVARLTAVPEPTHAALMACAALSLRRRRRR
jgi:hypothetical protein